MTQKEFDDIKSELITSPPLARLYDIIDLMMEQDIVFDAVAYDGDYGDEKKCVCGHDYYRHFDSYDGMKDVGCKYCSCGSFRPSEIIP